MLKIAIKDIKLFLRDKRAFMLTFFLPILLISIFAMAFGGQKREDQKPSVLVITDQDNSALTREAIASLDSLKSIEVQQVMLDSASEMVKKGDEPMVLVFHEGFEDSVNAGGRLPMELLYDPAREMEVGIMQQALMSGLMNAVGSKAMKAKAMKKITEQYAGADPAMLEAIKKQVEANFSGQEQASSAPLIEMTALIHEEEGTSLGIVQAVAGTAIMMLLFSVARFGGGLLTEKEEGTLRRLLYSPVRPGQILYGKLLANLFIAILQPIVMLVFASFMFKLDLTRNVPGLIVILLSSAFACAAFGVLLASIARTRDQLQMLATLVVLVMSAIGGSMIPVFIMPEWMQKLSVFSINYWSIQGFYDIFWRNRPMVDILMKAGVLTAIGAVFMVIAIRMFHKNVLKLS
jgi:ABC-2 type transport system permease protein